MQPEGPLERPGGGHRPNDPALLRVSDADRHAVAEVLRTAAGEGRLDIEELEERLEATFAAKTYADLAPITADLPAHGTVSRASASPVPRPQQPPAPPVATPPYASSFAMMSETKRNGAWLVGPAHSAVAVMGSVVLDLREAWFSQREVVISANALMGGVDILVNANTQVIVEGFGVMGDFSESKAKVPAQITADSPVVRVRGVAVMGAVNVKRKPMPGEPRRRFLGR